MLGSGWVLRLDHRKWLREGVGIGDKRENKADTKICIRNCKLEGD